MDVKSTTRFFPNTGTTGNRMPSEKRLFCLGCEKCVKILDFWDEFVTNLYTCLIKTYKSDIAWS